VIALTEEMFSKLYSSSIAVPAERKNGVPLSGIEPLAVVPVEPISSLSLCAPPPSPFSSHLSPPLPPPLSSPLSPPPLALGEPRGQQLEPIFNISRKRAHRGQQQYVDMSFFYVSVLRLTCIHTPT
jgi:hypothetical protein